MAQWPPSPIVEDEATALAKEHSSHGKNQTSKTEDHSIPSRGVVDQYPIICDPEPSQATVIPAVNSVPVPKTVSDPKIALDSGMHSSFQGRTGLQTPPPSDSESRGRTTRADVSVKHVEVPTTPRSKSATRIGDTPESRSRPTMSRIQTDVAGELERMKAGTRRAPSPYSYSREPANTQEDLSPRPAHEQFLSPTHATIPSAMTHRTQPRQEKQKDTKDQDSSTDSEGKPKKVLRFADKPLGPAPPPRPRKSFSLPDSQSHRIEVQSPQPTRSETTPTSDHRRSHHEYSSDAETHRSRRHHRADSGSRRASSQTRDSRHYSSSAEEAAKHAPTTSTKDFALEERPERRRSSHRRERPRLEEPLNYTSSRAKADTSDDDTMRRVYRIRDGRTPMTPPSVTTPNHMEDVFSRAFHDNALKHSNYTPRSSADDTAVFSPPSSPPRTPRSERIGRREYFESPSSSPHRTPRGSRPPSIEESQIRDLKAHHSLLSQATAGAAAVAARISPPATRTSSTNDASLSNPNHVIVTKTRSRASSPAGEAARHQFRAEPPIHGPPRSRASSPTRESTKPIIHHTEPSGQSQSRASSPQRDSIKNAAHRADSLNYGQPRSRASSPVRELVNPPARADSLPQTEPATTRSYYTTQNTAKRPSTRDGLPTIDLPSMTQPQRTASFTNFEQLHRIQATHLGGPLHGMTAMGPRMSGTVLNVQPPLLRSKSASNPEDVLYNTANFALPPCPRSKPTQGLRDWVTIRDIPNFDICPKCSHTLAATRYRDLLVRSLDKPYNKSTVCALSKPWVRIAVTQCVKQKRADLSIIRDANTLIEGARPCEGSEPDMRVWWRVPDSSTDRAVSDFFVCSACIGAVHSVYPEMKPMFLRDTLNQEKVCDLRCEGKNFTILTEKIEQIAEKCRHRGKSSIRYMQPLVDTINRLKYHAPCTKDKLLPTRAWHFIDQLPEFAICEACFLDIVWPVKDQPFARDICKMKKLLPDPPNTSTKPLVSCQLYSERMRRLFNDVVTGRIPWDVFRSKVKERQAAQYRLLEMNRMYEEDQKVGWDRRADIEKNKAYWRRLE